MNKNNVLYKYFSFNGLKHHLNFTKEYFENKRFLFGANSASRDFLDELKTVGTNITDIYIGLMSIRNIFDEISCNLKYNNHYDYSEFIKLFINSDYHKIEISDGSIWIIRMGKKKSEYIHIHPARAGNHTIRFPANTWKTALLCYHFHLNDSEFEFNLGTINYLRTSYLELPPVKRINQESNILEAFNLLLETTTI